MNRISDSLLEQACSELGLSLNMLPTGLLTVTDGYKSIAFPPGYLPLNTHAASALASDKRHCSALLREHTINVPDQIDVALNEDLSKQWPNIQKQAEQIGFPVFVKPDKGTMARGAARIPNSVSLHDHLELLARRFRYALIQPWTPLPEYRLFCLNGELQFSYQRTPASVTGDGKLTLTQLVEQHRQSHPRFDPEFGLDRQLIHEQLTALKMNWNSVISSNQQIQISSASNLLCGGVFSDLREHASDQCREWLAKLAEICNLRLFAVDLFSESRLENTEDYCVIDVNSNPQMNSLDHFGRRDLQLDIWKKILRLALEDAISPIHE